MNYLVDPLNRMFGVVEPNVVTDYNVNHLSSSKAPGATDTIQTVSELLMEHGVKIEHITGIFFMFLESFLCINCTHK